MAQNETTAISAGAEPTCRMRRMACGLAYPKSSCQKCGSLIRQGWQCAEGLAHKPGPTRAQIEAGAVAIANVDGEPFDLPKLNSIADFRFEPDRKAYERRAEAAIRAAALV